MNKSKNLAQPTKQAQPNKTGHTCMSLFSLNLQIQSKTGSLLGFTETCATEILMEMETMVRIGADKFQLLRHGAHRAQGILIQIHTLSTPTCITIASATPLVNVFTPCSQHWNKPFAETWIDPSLSPTTRGSCSVS